MDRRRPKVIIWTVLRVQEARKMNTVAAQSHFSSLRCRSIFFCSAMPAHQSWRHTFTSYPNRAFSFFSFFCVLLLVPSFFPFFFSFLCLTLLRDDDCCNVYVLSLLATIGQCMQHLNPLSRITFLLEICSTWLTEIS